MEGLFTNIADIGIPGALCFYTLFQVNRSIEKLIRTVEKFGEKLDRLEEKLTRS